MHSSFAEWLFYVCVCGVGCCMKKKKIFFVFYAMSVANAKANLIFFSPELFTSETESSRSFLLFVCIALEMCGLFFVVCLFAFVYKFDLRNIKNNFNMQESTKEVLNL
jgi:uncharacterized membrane protein